MYDEAADFAMHVSQIDTMDRTLAAAGAVPDWGRSLVCDLGGGGALRAALLSSRARKAYSADIIDQQARYEGRFIRLLAEKVGRHGHSLPIERLEVHVADAMDLFYRDGLFDFVCSVNAFEHIPDPGRALRETARVLKPGGIAYVSFDPLWTADSGSHFAHRVPEPWAHLVLTNDEFVQRMKDAGAEAGEVDEFNRAMNRVRLPVYLELFSSVAAELGLEVLLRNSWKGVTDEAHVRHPNYEAARRTYGEDELMTRGIVVVLRKR